MGILIRLFNLFRSNANDILNKAEDPEKMLQQMITDLESQKRKVKKQMTEALALQKGLERDTDKLAKIKPPFPRMTYDEAADLLIKNGSNFKYGSDFGAADETLLSENNDKPIKH